MVQPGQRSTPVDQVFWKPGKHMRETHHEAQRVKQGEWHFCTGSPELSVLHSSASSKDYSTLESSGVSAEPWVAAGQASSMGTTGKCQASSAASAPGSSEQRSGNFP